MNALANSQKTELEKFLAAGYPDGRGPVRFERYTGQEKRRGAPADHRQPARHPAHELRDAGADPHPDRRAPARLPRLRSFGSWCSTSCTPTGAARAPTLPCCAGGSATPAAPSGFSASARRPRWPAQGTLREQRAEVAGVATRLFGAPVRPDAGDRRDAGAGDRCRSRRTPRFRRQASRARSPARPPTAPGDYDMFAADPLARWIESTIGVAERGRPARARRATHPRRGRGHRRRTRRDNRRQPGRRRGGAPQPR